MKFERKYTLNENAFDNQLTEEKAYWLGFLAADGCVFRGQYGTTTLNVSLQETDKSHLIKLSKFLETDKPLCDLQKHKSCAFSVCSKKIADALAIYGIVERKSLTYEPPVSIINSTYERDYWRGVIDGDGWITHHKSSGVCLGLAGSKLMCERFLEYVSRQGIQTNAEVHQYKGKSAYYVMLSSLKAFAAMNLLYKDALIYLDRKYARFLECCRYREEDLYKPRRRTENNCKLVTYNGETLALVEWAKRYNVDTQLLYSRIRKGWDIGKALTAPVRRKKPNRLKVG